jgi:hypothetical protein
MLKDPLIHPNRGSLHAIGIEGEMVETRGHNDDSMSLILDSGLAFNDDLPLPAYASLENYQTTFDCRARLAAHKAQLIYPGYAHPFRLSDVDLVWSS